MIQSESPQFKEKPNPVVILWRHPLLQAFLNDPITLISGTFLAVVVLAVIFAPVVTQYDHQDQQLPLRHLAPFSTGIAKDRTTEPPGEVNRLFVLGTDHLGRDYFSRLVYGGRISLSVGVLGVLVSSTIGVFLGLIAGKP